MTVSKKSVAYHEAGHAVVANYLGFPFKYVTIEPDADEGSEGCLAHDESALKAALRRSVYRDRDIEIPDDVLSWAREELWADHGEMEEIVRGVFIDKSIKVSLAGAIAQRHFVPDEYDTHHDAADRQQAANFLLSDPPSEKWVELKWELLEIETESFIKTRWARCQIEAVTEALLERKTLTSDEVRKVATDALGSPIEVSMD